MIPPLVCCAQPNDAILAIAGCRQILQKPTDAAILSAKQASGNQPGV